MKNILIVSNFFHPEITPRAFRTTELVKEFCRRGDTVTLVLPNKAIYKSVPFEQANLQVVFAASPVQPLAATVAAPVSATAHAGIGIEAQIKSYLKTVAIYFFPKEIFRVYDAGITKALRSLAGRYDALVSVSHPLSIHLSVAIATRLNRSLHCRVKIAEFSDPMFKGKYLKTFPTNWLFGVLFSWTFRYFVIPIAAAIPAFLYFKSRKNIRVIPQGFNLSDIKLNVYSPNPVITFAYAGRFYKGLRDPEYFFQFLEKLTVDFVFKLYVPKDDPYFNALIETYREKVKGKFVVCDIVPRKQLLQELSEMDFLVNFNNEDAAMVPSKLIDYALTGRPIISFNSQTFDNAVFLEFVARNYQHAVAIDTTAYDIRNIVRSFDELMLDTHAA